MTDTRIGAFQIVDCGMFRAEDSGATLDAATRRPATGDLGVRST